MKTNHEKILGVLKRFKRPITAAEIAERLDGVDKVNVGSLLSVLRRRGLVQLDRAAIPAGWVITEAGRKPSGEES